jgi:hypothetical protein
MMVESSQHRESVEPSTNSQTEQLEIDSAENFNEISSSQRQSRRKRQRIGILLAAAISQLPIWGTKCFPHWLFSN